MNSFSITDIAAALPEIFVLAMGIVVLLVDLLLSDRMRYISYTLALSTLVGAFYLTLATHAPDATELAFHRLFVRDALGDVLKLMIYVGAFAALVYSRVYIAQRGMYRGEFFALTLFAVLGTMLMVSGSNFITLYMGLELLSLCLYSLVALDRENARATEAAMKYFVLGALASGMLLYGMSMIYGATGSLDIAHINQNLMMSAHVGGMPDKAVLILGLVFVVAGIAFKLGAVPFQMWVPDVYHGAPTAVTMLVGSFPKFAAFAFTVRLLVQGLGEMTQDWQGMLMIMAVLSIVVGNVTAIAQTNIKRMLAYSTISHIGFMLFGFFGAQDGIADAMFYVAAYVLMTLGAFGIIMLLSRKGFEAENLDDFKGLSKRSPKVAFIMLLLMFSMAGVPPTIGFDAKFTVLQAALQAGHVGLVIFAVLMAAVGAFYYLRVVKLMYFDEPQDHAPIVVQADVALVLGINGLAVLALGIMPQGLVQMCINAVAGSLGLR
jgi:NADH-quinone oxidoreductase subunit N